MENIIVFHGVDHKVGTTMISQSVAEFLASMYKELKVLFVTLNGREGAEYVNEVPETVEGLKDHIDSRMISHVDFYKVCNKKDNFYMLGGIKNEVEERYYYPDTADYLLTSIRDKFDIIIADSGNQLDNGLAMGALNATSNKFLVLTQQETIISRWEKMKGIYEQMNIFFCDYIVNKFYLEDPYSVDYIAERLKIERDKFKVVEFAGYGREAEIDGQTLLEYKNSKYIESIEEIANLILSKMDIPIIKNRRKHKWKNFI